LDAEKWRSITRKDIKDAGGFGILSHHNNSHYEALMNLYPEINFNAHTPLKEKGKWTDERNQRVFF